MTQWSRFKRNHGYNQDPYWYGERPRGLTIRRVFACLTCLLGGFGELRKGKGGKRQGGKVRKYRSFGGDNGEQFDIAYREDVRVGNNRYTMYS